MYDGVKVMRKCHASSGGYFLTLFYPIRTFSCCPFASRTPLGVCVLCSCKDEVKLGDATVVFRGGREGTLQCTNAWGFDLGSNTTCM